jgi:hypothetical protein
MHRSVIPVAFGLCAVSLVQVQCVRVRPDQPMTEKEKIEAMLCYQNEHGVPLARLRPDQGSIGVEGLTFGSREARGLDSGQPLGR